MVTVTASNSPQTTSTRSQSDTEFCIHCGEVTERSQLDTVWLCHDHWMLVVRVWGRHNGTRLCRLCELAGNDPRLSAGAVDGDTHLQEAHGVHGAFDYIRERERLLGMPSPSKRGVQVDEDDTYRDQSPQTDLERWS